MKNAHMVLSRCLCVLSLVIVLSIFSCQNTKNNERIIFTIGFSMNPDTPRFGIEIKNDTVFYCEEIIARPGSYNYYFCDGYDKGKLKGIQKKIKQVFNVKIEQREIPDATFCQLNIIEGGKNIVKTFYLEKLKPNQREEVVNLIALKKCALKAISYHDFPGDLLRSELPIPPLSPK